MRKERRKESRMRQVFAHLEITPDCLAFTGFGVNNTLAQGQRATVSNTITRNMSCHGPGRLCATQRQLCIPSRHFLVQHLTVNSERRARDSSFILLVVQHYVTSAGRPNNRPGMCSRLNAGSSGHIVLVRGIWGRCLCV